MSGPSHLGPPGASGRERDAAPKEPVTKKRPEAKQSAAAAQGGSRNGKETAGDGKEKEKGTPWWAEWKIMVPLVGGTAVAGFLGSLGLSSRVHKHVVSTPSLQSKVSTTVKRLALESKVIAPELPSKVSTTVQAQSKVSTAAPPSKGQQPSQTLVTDPAMTVTVEKGDTLYGISRKCQVAVRDLRTANNLKGDLILPGTKLFIPGVIQPDELATEDEVDAE